MFAASEWLETFQGLVNHWLPPLESSPALSLSVGSLVVAAAGLLMALRGGKLLRWLVTCFGLLIGTWLGVQLAVFVGTPRPITAAVCGVAASILAYRTYKAWLVGGSVVTLFALGLGYQLGRGDLNRFLQGDQPVFQNDMLTSIPTPEEQMKNWPTRAELLDQLRERAWTELESLGPTGWILPLVAAIIGGFLAWKALTIFAVVWIGFLGATMAVLGGVTFLGTQWSALRPPMTDNPQVLVGVTLALWIAGLILQAREARIPSPAPQGGKGEAAKRGAPRGS